MTAVPALPDRACWSVEDAIGVLRTEALSNDKHVFLATHTPVEELNVTGIGSATVTENSERGLLASLSDPSRRHAFAAVLGEPGSGKSHLIRWLAASWPEGRDLPVLLQRADASLEGSLKGLRNAIPPQYRDVVGHIEVRQEAAMAGRIADFMSNLSNALDPDYFEQAPADRQFCAEYAPGDILSLPEVRRGWKAPMRILDLLAGASGDRNSQSAAFTIYEAAALVEFSAAVPKTNVKAQRLLRHIGHELDVIEACEREGIPSDRVMTSRRHEVRHAAMLVDAFNDRRNHAIQNSLGVSTEKLKGIFLDLRRALKKDGLRLVILLEDITAWEGVDDSLIDVLVIDATTAPELCDQITVVGVTPYYYGRLPGNYRQRITHAVSLGEGDGALQDVANFRDPRTRTRFVATYLRAVRAGTLGIERWWDRRKGNDEEPVPNVCADCPLGVRAGCHATFGSVDDVGLYPFTERAVQNFYEALKAQDNGMTWRTPRGVIQGVLVPTLMRPGTLAERAYPSVDVESHSGIERDHTNLPGLAGVRLRSALPDGHDQERARRLIAFWGDRTSLRTEATEDGRLSYAEVSRSVFDAFAIPWIGDDGATADRLYPQGRADGPMPQDPDPAKPTSRISRALDAPVRDPSIAASPPKPKDPVPKPASTAKATPREVSEFLLEVAAFRRDRTIKTPSLWNRFAQILLAQIEPHRLDIDPTAFRALFKPDLVKIKGTSRVDRAGYFELPDDDWMLDGLAAFAEFRNQDHLETKSPQEQDAIRRSVGRCLRRIEHLARDHVARRMPATSNGRFWSQVGALVQALVVRAWLRGDVSPTAPIEEQWRTILKGEDAPRTESRSRVDAWGAVIRSTDQTRHGDMRDLLREAIRLGQGDGTNYGLVDAAAAVRALSSLTSEFRLADCPDDLGDLSKEAVFALPFSAAEAASNRLGRLPQDEYARLRDRAGRIEVRRREEGISSHLTRLALTITTADKGLLPTQKSRMVQPWLKEYERFTSRVDFEAVVNAVEDALTPLLDDTRKPPRRLDLLAMVAEMGAGDIEAVDQILEGGEKVVEDLRVLVGDFVASNRSSSLDLGEIRSRGASLAGAMRHALAAWGSHA